MPPVKILQTLSPDDWECFTEEWLTFYKDSGVYSSIKRYSGPGDLGLDVVAFTSPDGFEAPWDSYQCKHYGHPLEPGDVLGEVGKIIYHSFRQTPPFNRAMRVPRSHVFVAPRGVGTSLSRFLDDPQRFKATVKEKWDTHCVPKVGKDVVAPLEREMLEYFEKFDFSIFASRPPVELVAEHSQTVFHAARFGGGLPLRGEPGSPPSEPTADESLYLRKLLDAYGDHLGRPVDSIEDLDSSLAAHFTRQRVLFYSAESLRNFARDRTPAGTFASLQDDVYHGVIDVCERAHVDSLARLRETIVAAAQTSIDGNALAGVTRVTDKQGVCHQLANDDRLTWKGNT